MSLREAIPTDNLLWGWRICNLGFKFYYFIIALSLLDLNVSLKKKCEHRRDEGNTNLIYSFKIFNTFLIAGAVGFSLRVLVMTVGEVSSVG